MADDTTETHILDTFEKYNKCFMSYWQECVFTKVAINGKILEP